MTARPRCFAPSAISMMTSRMPLVEITISTSLRAEGEVAQDLLGVAQRLLQVQALAQAVGADDEVVKRQAQLDDGVPADEAALARRHLLAHHPAVAAAEQVDQAVGGDGVGAKAAARSRASRCASSRGCRRDIASW